MDGRHAPTPKKHPRHENRDAVARPSVLMSAGLLRHSGVMTLRAAGSQGASGRYVVLERCVNFESQPVHRSARGGSVGCESARMFSPAKNPQSEASLTCSK